MYSGVIAQNNDTVLYHDKTILMITSKINNYDSVLIMYDQKGKNILTDGPILYSFFDAKFGKKRNIKLENRIYIEDYCVAESDTIFNYFPFDEAFNSRLKQYYQNLEQSVIYPRNALKKGIQAQVKVSLIIDNKGSITNIIPITKHEWGFEETLISTITSKKQFGYILYKNKPIKLYLEIPFAFKIKNK
jgi:hypothetical protein